MEATCRWDEDEEGNWTTACGNVHVFIDGGPEENGYAWCAYCGLRLYAWAFEGEVILEEDDDGQSQLGDEGSRCEEEKDGWRQ